MNDYIKRDFALDVVKRTSGDYVAAWAEIAHAPAADVAPVPLTLEQLREMDGEPVWVKCLKPSQYTDPPVRWRILEKSMTGNFGVWNRDSALIERTYGVDWLAYRRPPEGEEDT